MRFRLPVLAVLLLLPLAARPARAQSAADFEQILKQMAQQAAALQAKADSMARQGLAALDAPRTEGPATPLSAQEAQLLSGALKTMEQSVAEAAAAAGVDLSHLSLPGVSIPKPTVAPGRTGGGCGAAPDPRKAADVKAQLDRLRATKGADAGTIRSLSRLYNLYSRGASGGRNCRFG